MILKKYNHLMKDPRDIILLLDYSYSVRDVFAIKNDWLAYPRDSIIGKRISFIFDYDKSQEFIGILDKFVYSDSSAPLFYSYKLELNKKLLSFSCLIFKDTSEDNMECLVVIITLCDKSENIYHFNLDHIMMGILDVSGFFLNTNNLWDKTMGYQIKDIHNLTIIDLLHPRDRSLAVNFFEDIIHTNVTRKISNRCKKKDGTWIWLEWNFSFLDGLIYFSAKDISVEMVIENQLKTNEENFRKFFDALDDMLIVSGLDGKIIYMNDAVIITTGFSAQELLDMHILDLHSKEHRYKAMKIFEDMIKGLKKECNLPVVNKFGKVIPVSTKVFSGFWNSKACIYAVIHDQTKIIAGEAKLKRLGEIKSVLMNLATTFINLPLDKINQGISDSLELMGNFVAADRVYIFKYDFENEITANTHEWCRLYIEPQIEFLQNIPLNTVSVWLNNHLKGREILIERIEEYHEDDDTKKILKEQGIKSLLTVPMMKGNACLGFVGFDSVLEYRNYAEDEIQLLKLYAQMLVNVQNRAEQELRIKNSLDEKIVLMQEIHHRVKNNLQIVSSLLFLQANSVEDSSVRSALVDSENRVKAMALLHENIYQANNLVDFNFKKYLNDIISQISRYYDYSSNVRISIQIDDVSIEPDRAILVGLILNELLTNSYKHAFDECSEGEIHLKLIKTVEKSFTLSFYDNGTGFDKHDEKTNLSSFGLQLIGSLVKQLKGTMELSSLPQKGTAYMITLPLAKE